MRAALLEFLVHGVKYAFAPERGELTRGVPTGYAAPPLDQSIAGSSEPPPVWPYAEGKVRGYAFAPLYRTVPEAALRDPALGDLRERVTFVGGCATALLITDPAAAPVRATQDVDAIVAAVSLADYHRIGGALRERGFVQTLEEGEPAYRWTYAGLKLDLMPADAGILGFSNRWYNALPGLVIDGSPAVRTPVVRERLRAIAAMRDKTWVPE